MRSASLSCAIVLLCVAASTAPNPSVSAQKKRIATLSKEEYLDKVHGWWLGKIIGVTAGLPFEFTMPWPPREVSFYTQDPLPAYARDNDDLYVGLTYLLAVERYGPGLSQEQMAAEFLYRLHPSRLWLANKEAYENLHAGIPPPKTGHPFFNRYFSTIDAQIENDIWGVICPGMINTACEYADRASHITNYADGACGGVFAAALASGAFFEDDIGELVEAALATIPPESDYAAAVRDVIRWHGEDPSSWKATREKIKSKWQDEKKKDEYSAVINGASVVMALLYSGGDFDTAVTIGTMGGWDCDCNPSTAGGVLGIMRGARAIPEKWNIFNDTYRNETLRGIPEWVKISDLAEKTAEIGGKVVLAHGGREEKGGYVIEMEEPVLAMKAERPREEMKKDSREWAMLSMEKLQNELRLWNPDVTMKNCAADGSTGLLDEFQGKRYVFKTAPRAPSRPCVLSLAHVPGMGGGGDAFLDISVSSGDDETNEWDLSVRVDGKLLDTVRIKAPVPPRYRADHIVPRRDKDIVLYVAKDGSTYYDRDLTKLARASDLFDPRAKPEPLRVRTVQNNFNMFPYKGKCPPDKKSGEIRSYFIRTEWADTPHVEILWLTPGDPFPFGCYYPQKTVPRLPLPPPRPVKLRISAEEELPDVPDGGKFVLIHDEGSATFISLPRISVTPSPWYRLRYDLSAYRGKEILIELASTPAGKSRGKAFWEYVKVPESPSIPF